MRLDDPEVVRQEYANEARLQARRSIYQDAEGPHGPAVVFDVVAGLAPQRVLEVGCGPGELAARVAELGAETVAVDLSPRMVELARARGVDARLGDVQELPFADGEFDCAVAAWMLYHVPDLDRGLRELRRVLRPGGSLVAATNGAGHLREVLELAGVDFSGRSSFTSENGDAVLRRHFDRVDRRDLAGSVVLPGWEAVRDYLASLATMQDFAERVPRFTGPLRATRASTIFVATAA